eukprot:CAMPEP_0180638878 /NCGR_PEP_ID=MMETSP1037_2-20121125/44627_1 /TAXON_ID=632150 /ORGANISM="Azadinium spinosum, Strain 3D9" /LENGTH=65 /DNA_ID=CAMNT_0022660571 /DNA_START=606 /DNA_END=800 /DNA_ORIENTATION=-
MATPAPKRALQCNSKTWPYLGAASSKHLAPTIFWDVLPPSLRAGPSGDGGAFTRSSSSTGKLAAH